ncbi:MAG: hypothetical protein OEZ21_07485 [Candidatus Bathyarchaeota archaeon]|nr:hypothetical protein [Candidatus Bathyarchaeota archaeon]
MLIEWSELVEWPGILLILSITFAVHLFGFVTIPLAENYRLVITLEYNPNRYWGYMRDAFVFLILPPAVGLAFTVVAFVRERRRYPNGLRGVLCLPLMVVGGFLFWWGLRGARWMCSCYHNAFHLCSFWLDLPLAHENIASLIQKICATAGVGFILWLIVGLLWLVAGLFVMLSGFKVILRKKDTRTTS